MKKVLYLVVLCTMLGLTLSSCGDDDDQGMQHGTLEIYFEPVYGSEGELIDRTTNFDYPSGNQIRFIVSDMFLGPFVIGNGATEHEISEIEYINLSEPVMDSESGLTDKFLVFENIPAGNYDFLNFGIGVPEDLNAMTPSDFSSGHPLRRESHFWPPWNSFIFSKIEGRLDVDNDGSFGLNFVYHAGLNELYRSLNLQGDFQIESGDVTRMVFTIDHEKLFVRTQEEFLNIEDNPIDHSAGDLAYMHFIADNYPSAISVRVLSE